MSDLKLAILERDLSTSKQSHIKHVLFAESNMKEINYMAFFEVTAILYYRQNQYKPDHKELAFEKVTKVSAKPKRGIVERIGDAISNPRPLVGLSEMMINAEKLKDASEVYPNFLGIEKTTTLIRSPLGTWKTTALREIIVALKDKVHDI